ncbi:hypothetical protein C4K23_2621 [Pseudomonas chlororaphis]|nr:hypothetical protein C4K23_2621 [Pseudomonas chlororaphis]
MKSQRIGQRKWRNGQRRNRHLGRQAGRPLPMRRRPDCLVLPKFGAVRTVFHGPVTSRLFSSFRSMA